MSTGGLNQGDVSPCTLFTTLYSYLALQHRSKYSIRNDNHDNLALWKTLKEHDDISVKRPTALRCASRHVRDDADGWDPS